MSNTDANDSLLIRSARTLDGSLCDIEVEGGVITSLLRSQDVARPTQGAKRGTVIDANGSLVLPGFFEPHAHLDKVFSGFIAGLEAGNLQNAVDRFAQSSSEARFDAGERRSAARRGLERLVAAGVSRVRTHVDIGVETAFDHLAAVQDAHEELARLIDLEIVALAYNPLIGREGQPNRRSLAAALERGATLVGGAPQFSTDPAATVRLLTDIAQDAHVAIDLHIDESLDPNQFLLPLYCRLVAERGLSGSAVASHCVSLSTQPLAVQIATAELAHEAGVAIVALPQTNLLLQGREAPVATPRGIAPISLLRQHGVKVLAGADNVGDPFNPIGTLDPLETAVLCVYAAHQSPEQALQLITNHIASPDVPARSISVGSPSDLVVFDAGSAHDLLSNRYVGRTVIRHGRVVSQTTVQQRREPHTSES